MPRVSVKRSKLWERAARRHRRDLGQSAVILALAEAYFRRALSPDQTIVEIKVYQSEDSIASQNTLLGEFKFERLKPEAPGLAARDGESGTRSTVPHKKNRRAG